MVGWVEIVSEDGRPNLAEKKRCSAYLVGVMIMMSAGPKKESDPNDKSLWQKISFKQCANLIGESGWPQ